MTDSQLQSFISAIDQASSPTQLIGAVRALAMARLEAGIPTLIQALGYNNPGAAVVAVDGLVQLGEIAVAPLLEQIDGYNYGARAYGIRALAAIADPRALEVLLVAAETDFAPSVRRAATKGLGRLQWHQLPTVQQQEAQLRVLNTLLSIVNDPDWAIRYAAVVALETLAVSMPASVPALQILHDRLQTLATTDPSLATQARAKLACDRLNLMNNQRLTACC